METPLRFVINSVDIEVYKTSKLFRVKKRLTINQLNSVVTAFNKKHGGSLGFSGDWSIDINTIS